MVNFFVLSLFILTLTVGAPACNLSGARRGSLLCLHLQITQKHYVNSIFFDFQIVHNELEKVTNNIKNNESYIFTEIRLLEQCSLGT